MAIVRLRLHKSKIPPATSHPHTSQPGALWGRRRPGPLHLDLASTSQHGKASALALAKKKGRPANVSPFSEASDSGLPGSKKWPGRMRQDEAGVKKGNLRSFFQHNAARRGIYQLRRGKTASPIGQFRSGQRSQEVSQHATNPHREFSSLQEAQRKQHGTHGQRRRRPEVTALGAKLLHPL
jgi:hypothetical protein